MMGRKLESITPETDVGEALGLILDAVLDSVEPDVAEAIYICAIPHWFDEEILAWLRGEGREASRRTQEILGALTKDFVFVNLYHNRGYAYHENVRNMLLGRWREGKAESFKKLSEKAAAHYADKLQGGSPHDDQYVKWEREEMYHLLVADEERGIDLFIQQVEQAGVLHQLSTLDLLLDLAREQAIELSVSNRPWIRFFEGRRAYLSGDWQKTLRLWESLEVEREQVSRDLEKTLAAHLCFLYKDKGEWDKAVGCLQRSLDILERWGDRHGMASALNNLGFLYKDKGEWKKADEYFRRSLKTFEILSDERGMAGAFNSLGLLYKDREEWKRAGECFEHSLELLEKVDDEIGMITISENLGFLYKDEGEWEKADEYFQRSLKILRKIGDARGEAGLLTSLGFLCLDKGELEKAESYFRSSLETFKGLGDERRMADVFSHLGSLYQDKGEWKEAAKYFRRGLEILEKMGDERGEGGAYNNLGLLYKERREWKKAAKYFEHSLEILEKVGDEMNVATAIYNFALLRYDEAVELLERVVDICERVGHPDLTIRERSKKILDKAREEM